MLAPWVTHRVAAAVAVAASCFLDFLSGMSQSVGNGSRLRFMLNTFSYRCLCFIIVGHLLFSNRHSGHKNCTDHMSSIECRHSRHKQFRHKLFFEKNLCTRTGMFFIRLSSQLWSPLVVAAALFVLSLLHRGCVLEESGTFSQDEHWLLRHQKPYRPNIYRKLLVRR